MGGCWNIRLKIVRNTRRYIIRSVASVTQHLLLRLLVRVRSRAHALASVRGRVVGGARRAIVRHNVAHVHEDVLKRVCVEVLEAVGG